MSSISEEEVKASNQAGLAPVLDVARLDSHLIRSYLLEPFVSLLQNESSPLSVTVVRYKEALGSLLLAVTFLYSRGQTPAVRALGLRFRGRKEQLFLYAFLRFVVPSIYRSLVSFYATHEVSDDCHQGRVARERRQKVLSWVRATLERTTPVIQWCTLMACWSGRLTTPDWAMVASGCRYEQQLVPTLFVNFAHRRWLWALGLSVAQLYTSGWSFIKWNEWVKPKRPSSGCVICSKEPMFPTKALPCEHEPYCYMCLFRQTSCAICSIKLEKASVLNGNTK